MGEHCSARIVLELKAYCTSFFSLGTLVMSDFIDSEAEESEEEFEEKDLKPRKTQRFLEEEGKSEYFSLVDALHLLAFFDNCRSTIDEEDDAVNPEEQDEHGNLRGLIDDGDDVEEEEEAAKDESAPGSDSEEEVRHRRKKRSRLNVCYFLKTLLFSFCTLKTSSIK